MSQPVPFPEPTHPIADRREVMLGYLAFFRDRVTTKVASLPDVERRATPLPSGWSPVELIRHLQSMERRWVEWGFAGAETADPWNDERDGRWFVDGSVAFGTLCAEMLEQGRRTERIVRARDLTDIGAPGPRWDGAPPATLERVLLHVTQEYARHLGQLDAVVELLGGDVGE